MTDARVNIQFESSFNSAGAKQAEDSTKRVRQAAESGKKSVSDMGNAFGGLGTQASGVVTSLKGIDGIVGRLPNMIAQMAIPAAVINSVRAYLDTVGSATELGNNWMVATDKIQDAYMRLGETIAKDVLPYLEQAADAASKIEISSPKQAFTDLQNLTDIGFGALTDSIVSAIMGTPNQNYYAKGAFQNSREFWNGDKYDAQGNLVSSGAASDQNAGKPDDIPYQKVMQYYQLYRQQYEQDIKYQRQLFVMRREFEKQEQYAEYDFNKTRYRAQRDFNRQITYANEDFYKTQFRSIRDFQRSESITIEQYNRQRTIAARDFQISMARNEYDYQKQRARAQYDHNWSIRMAMLEGDAMAIWQANRQFKIEKERAEEDYQLSKQRSIEDFQRQQADEAYQFQIERQNAAIQFQISRQDAAEDFEINRKRQLEQFDISRKDQEEDFEIQRSRRLYQYGIQQQDMVYQYEQEIRIRNQMFIDSTLPNLIHQENMKAEIMMQIGDTIVQHYQSLLAGIQSGNLVASSSSGWKGLLGGYDIGGKINSTGTAMLHEGEFVLTRNTVNAVESLAKSNQLTQTGILEMLSAGSRGGNQFVFNRAVPVEERQALQDWARNYIDGAF